VYCFIDESGNTGLELFDPNQPILYYGLLIAQANLDVVAEPLLKDLRRSLGVNLIGFQQVLHTIALQSSARGRVVRRITVDRQTEFNGAQGELAVWYQKLRGHETSMGPGMPTFDYSHMPEVPPTFTPGDASAGLELVDITLWIEAGDFSEIEAVC